METEISNNILSGKEVADFVKNQIKSELKIIEKNNARKPCLAVILVGEDPASKVYVANKQKTCDELGFVSKVYRLAAETSQKELLELIEELNADKTVDGILTQMPLPQHISENEVINKIDPLKDVDCFHPENIGLMFSNHARFLPCTPFGILELLDFKKINLKGKNVVIIGRSNIVGKPAAILFLQKNATVTICHSKTLDLEKIASQADILVVAIGKARFVTENMIKKGAIVIDVGMNREDGKLFGDVDFANVAKKTSLITPVPGGVGLMTIAMLMKNTLIAYKIHEKLI